MIEHPIQKKGRSRRARPLLPNCLLLTRQLTPTSLHCMRVVWQQTNLPTSQPCIGNQPLPCRDFFESASKAPAPQSGTPLSGGRIFLSSCSGSDLPGKLTFEGRRNKAAGLETGGLVIVATRCAAARGGAERCLDNDRPRLPCRSRAITTCALARRNLPDNDQSDRGKC
jgi:hypothetical protein